MKPIIKGAQTESKSQSLSQFEGIFTKLGLLDPFRLEGVVDGPAMIDNGC